MQVTTSMAMHEEMKSDGTMSPDMAERSKENGRGLVIWFTGLPASGKSTLAASARKLLAAHGHAALLLDSDAIRPLIAPGLGYEPEDRDAFYWRLAELAGLLADQGLVILVAATAALRSYREVARRRAPAYAEVYLDVGREECARRDPKRLFAKARAAMASDLAGSRAAYEPPLHPSVVASGGRDQAAVEAVLRLVDTGREGGTS